MPLLPTRWIPRSAGALLLVTLAATLPAAVAGEPCHQDGRNMQCNSLGSITMDSQRDVHGDPISLQVQVTLRASLADQGARWVLFSVRNTTSSSPVWIQVDSFRTPDGDVLTTRAEKVSPSQVDLWVDVVDLPVGKPITLNLTVGATDRGAFRVETLVMPFDRGYASVPDATQGQASLFSFTLLGVNGATGGPSDGGGLLGHKLPGWEAAWAAAAVVGAAALVRGRRTA